MAKIRAEATRTLENTVADGNSENDIQKESPSSNNGSELLNNGEQKKEVPSEVLQYADNLAWWAEKSVKAAGFGGLFFVLYLVLFSHMDYAGLIGVHFGTAEIGSHSPAYSMAFHLCLLLSGWGVLGVQWRRIGFMSLALFGVVGLCPVSFTALVIWCLRGDASLVSSIYFLVLLGIFSTSLTCAIALGYFINVIMKHNIPQIHYVW